MMRLIYLFLPVVRLTSIQELVESYLLIVAFKGPYCCPLIVKGEFIFYTFYGVNLPCTLTLYRRSSRAVGFYKSPFRVLSLVTRSSPYELKSSLPTDIKCPYFVKSLGKSE